MADPLRVLLVGCGGITAAHLPAFLRFPDHLRLVAACDPVEAAREGVAGRLAEAGPVELHAGHREALEREAGRVDAALVTTPHHLHFPMACDCLEAGLPVLVEKPLCIHLDEARRLRDLAEASGKLVVAGQNRRYQPQALWLKEWMAASPQHFGPVQSFELFAFQNILSWIATKPNPSADFWILDRERAGGGVVMSLLVHYLDLIRGLTGLDYTRVSALGRFEPPFRNGAESSCNALLTLSNGAGGSLHANYLAPAHRQAGEGFTMLGQHGYVAKLDRWEYASRPDGSPPPWETPDAGIAPVPTETRLAPSSDSFTNQLLAFAASVRHGTVPMNTIADNFNTLATIDSLYQSLREGGCAVDVPAA